MDEFEEWIAALSGKIQSISADGVILLEAAGLQVFRKEKERTKTYRRINFCLTF